LRQPLHVLSVIVICSFCLDYAALRMGLREP